MKRAPALMMKDYYMRCSEFLRLQERPDAGITVICTTRWFFIGLLTQPYCAAPNGHPVYLDGFDFCGLVSMQETEDTWPGIAGLEDQSIGIFEAYHKSTKIKNVIEEDSSDDDQNKPAGVIIPREL